MILVDTSVWIDHFRKAERTLTRLLEDLGVATHPFVIGEIALGSIRDRREILSSLDALPALPLAMDDEVRAFIDAAELAGSGVGYLDAHLLASLRLRSGARLWTRDRRLKAAATALDLAAAHS